MGIRGYVAVGLSFFFFLTHASFATGEQEPVGRSNLNKSSAYSESDQKELLDSAEDDGHMPECALNLSPEVKPSIIYQKRLDLVGEYNRGTDPTYGKHIRASLAPEHQTITVFHSSGRVHEHAKARVLLLHGMGASYSNHGAMRTLVTNLGDPNRAKKGSTRRFLQNLPDYISLATEAIDLPGHGVGPELDGFETLEKTVDWLSSYLRQMKAKTPELPLIVVGRSASPALAVEVSLRNPDLIDALVLMSPAMPGDPEVLEQQNKILYNLEKQGTLELNHRVLKWVDSMLLGIQFQGEAMSKTPTLILTGSEDAEVLPVEKEFYRSLSAYPNIRYVDIEGASHDVFSTARPFEKAGKRAFAVLYKFLKSALAGKLKE